MLNVVTAGEMQLIDSETIHKFGISGIVLMERAGLSVVKRIHELFLESSEPGLQSAEKGKVIVLCGGGNNGGDGFVISRILHNEGIDVDVYMTTSARNLKGDARMNYDAVKKFGVNIQSVDRFLRLGRNSISRNSLIVDALLGTGLSREVRHPLDKVIKRVNRLGCKVVSVDIPSGISSDDGKIMGFAIKAWITVTFGLPKRGHLLYPGAEYAGRLFVEDIGFPRTLLHSDKVKVNLIQSEDAALLLPSRPKNSHKGSFGHVLLIAGSRGKTGAALMAARACLNSGAGLVTIGTPESLVNTLQSRVTEEMILPLADKGNGTLSLSASETILRLTEKKIDVLAIGPGISTDKDISKLVSILIQRSKVPIVIDADGLNALEGRTDILKRAVAPIILTPHPGEMMRLINKGYEVRDRGTVEEDRISIAIAFAKKTKTLLVLKGVPTVTATHEGKAFINSSGNPGMATAGTGDVLTGMISAFLSQKLDPLNAAILGVYLHGYVGDIVAAKKGQFSLIASDIIRAIPKGFESLKNGNNHRSAKH